MTFLKILINAILIAIGAYLAVTLLMVLSLTIVSFTEYGDISLRQELYANLIGIISWQVQRFFLIAGIAFGLAFFIADFSEYLFKAFGYDFAAFVSNLSLKRLGHA